MGIFADHFIAEAEGRTIEVVALLTGLLGARYSLIIDGGLGDTASYTLWGGFLLVLGVRECVLWAERLGQRPEAEEEERSSAVMIRPEGVQGVGGVTSAAAPERFEPVRERAAGDVTVAARILQGWFGTGVELLVNGMPVPMRRLR
jgi:hypothetical protein